MVIPQISAEDAYLHIQKGAILLDVREADEVIDIACDIENSLHIHMSQFQTQMQNIPKDKEIITVCHSGGRSYVATQLLIAHGFEKVLNLSGGIIGWENAKLPLK